MTDKLGYCSEHLCKAVVYMAASDGTSQEKLRGMAANTGFESIAEDDFPRGPNAVAILNSDIIELLTDIHLKLTSFSLRGPRRPKLQRANLLAL